jgi:hypothetical protein
MAERLKRRQCALYCDNNNVVLEVDGKRVFDRPRTPQTLAIVNTLYFGYKYDNGSERSEKIMKGEL